jgi:hypothetical protein
MLTTKTVTHSWIPLNSDLLNLSEQDFSTVGQKIDGSLHVVMGPARWSVPHVDAVDLLNNAVCRSDPILNLMGEILTIVEQAISLLRALDTQKSSWVQIRSSSAWRQPSCRRPAN